MAFVNKIFYPFTWRKFDSFVFGKLNHAFYCIRLKNFGLLANDLFLLRVQFNLHTSTIRDIE